MTAERTYTPAEVGQQLGVKPGMAGRYVRALEAVTGPLPREPRRNARVVTDEQLTLLLAAREMVQGRQVSAEQAIGELVGVRSDGALTKGAPALLELLQRQQEAIDRLEAKVDALHRQLPAPKVPWWRRLFK